MMMGTITIFSHTSDLKLAPAVPSDSHIFQNKAYYYKKNAPTDEELEKVLRKDYSHNIENSQKRSHEMVKFINDIKNKSNASRDDQLMKILQGGKDGSGVNYKRSHEVDENVYGTTEGAEKAEKLQAKQLLKQKKKKKKLKKKKRDAKLQKDQPLQDTSDEKRDSSISTKSKAGMGLALLALTTAGILLGKNDRK